jgi:hypothetical protein
MTSAMDCIFGRGSSFSQIGVHVMAKVRKISHVPEELWQVCPEVCK